MKSHTPRFAAFLIGSVFACSCSSDKSSGPRDGGNDGGSDAGAGPVLRVATFNAGLLDSVGYVPQRAPLVAKALGALDVDVLCVQEAWQAEDWTAIASANKSKRPHTLYLDPKPGAVGKCGSDEFVPLEACAKELCGDADASSLVSCTTVMCPDEVAALSGACIQCLLDNASSGDFAAIGLACVGAGGGAADAGAPSPDDRAYLLGGSFGVGLLSSLPLTETDSLVLDSSTNRRAILYAKINDPRLGTIHTFCTHLGPIENGVKYEGSFDSWEGENAAHVKALVDWAKEKTGGDGQVLLLGDFNTGPAGKQIAPSVPDNYAQLPKAGFVDPFLDGPNASCTYCKDNALVIQDDAAADAAIDHIMTRGLTAKIDAVRILTDDVEIDPNAAMQAQDGGAADAGQKRIPLSDHYGLQAAIGQ